MNEKFQQKQHIQGSAQTVSGCFIAYITVAIISAIIVVIGVADQSISEENLGAVSLAWIILNLTVLVPLLIWGHTISSQQKDWLKAHGQTVQATVIKSHFTSVPDSYGYGSTTTYYLDLEWQDPQTGKTYTFSTSAASATYPLGSHVSVRIDPNDPTFYRITL